MNYSCLVTVTEENVVANTTNETLRLAMERRRQQALDEVIEVIIDLDKRQRTHEQVLVNTIRNYKHHIESEKQNLRKLGLLRQYAEETNNWIPLAAQLGVGGGLGLPYTEMQKHTVAFEEWVKDKK